MNIRDKFHATMNFENTDSLCHVEHGFWNETYDRWKKEGLQGNITMPNLYYLSEGEDLFKHFNIAKFGYVRPNNYVYPPSGNIILEDTDEYTIFKNSIGATIKVSKSSCSLPGCLDYEIKSRKTYEEFKEKLIGNIEERYPDNWDTLAAEMKNQNHTLVCTHMDGFFAYPRELMGVENMLMMFYDDPEFMKDMIDDRVNFYMELYEKAIVDTKPDFAFIWEDMCFINGPLVSPAIFREFMLPAYKKLTSDLRDMGIKNVIVDSDGDVTKLIPLWLEGGVNGLLPFEVNSGMDVVKIGEEFPTLRIFGGIDKFRIAAGKKSIDEELNRVLPIMKKRGGYFVSVDHWVPPEISLEDFAYYVSKAQKY